IPNGAVDIPADRADARALGRRAAPSQYPDLAGFIAQLISPLPKRAEAVSHGPDDQNLFSAITRRVAVDLVDAGLLWAGRKEDRASEENQRSENTSLHFSTPGTARRGAYSAPNRPGHGFGRGVPVPTLLLNDLSRGLSRSPAKGLFRAFRRRPLYIN